MELDELKEKWAEYDHKLDLSIRLTKRLLDAPRMNRARTALRWFAFFLTLEVAVALAVVAALGSFLADHITSLQFAVPAAVLHLFEVATLIVLIRQIMLALAIDYSQPVAAIQRRLESLRVLHVRQIQWTLFASPLLWPPLLIVGLKAFLGVDAYRLLGISYLFYNLLFGIAFLVAAIWVARKFSERMKHFPWVRRLMRALAGYELNAATAFLVEITEFEAAK